VDFSSYANSRITGAILDELRKWDTCSRRDRRTAREIEVAKHKLRGQARREPSREEIAEAVGLGLAAYDQTMQRLEAAKQPAMQASEQDLDPCDELSQIPSKGHTPFEACSKNEDLAHMRSHIMHLKPRYRRVLHLYYFKEMGLKEIGEELGVGEARVSQIHKQAIEELRRITQSSQTGSTFPGQFDDAIVVGTVRRLAKLGSAAGPRARFFELASELQES
jgi:RNA polymerase sigma factor for flagellar operon FliA